MTQAEPAPQVWLHPSAMQAMLGADSAQDMARQWQGFMTARLILGCVLVLLHLTLYTTGTAHNQPQIIISMVYLLGTLASKLLVQPRPLGQSFNRVWGALVGIDLLTFSALQMLQGGTTSVISYTPLFTLPVLVASVLGSMRLALGTAAGITVLMLAVSAWSFWHTPSDPTLYFVQPALGGVGYFAVAWLSNQLAARVAAESLRARQSQLSADIQRHVNTLVIESLRDGILIADADGKVHAANPAARLLLGADAAASTLDLAAEPGWLALRELTRKSVVQGANQEADVTVDPGNQTQRRLHVQTRLTQPHAQSPQRLCVLFLQDQREMEARLRTEKLAGMGRLSTAVAHEIRNPLAAISQASALLDESVSEPHLRQLTAMIGQNAKRLERIVNDILNVTRVQTQPLDYLLPSVDLAHTVARLAQDWCTQSNSAERLWVHDLPAVSVRFDTEHLRRVLVNLLDNARRHTPDLAQAIQVLGGHSAGQQVYLAVWSDAPPLDPSVESHLFEPFFSSDSRSSGLGLFICRELCERNGAVLSYQRTVRQARHGMREGNEFVMMLNATASTDNVTNPRA